MMGMVDRMRSTTTQNETKGSRGMDGVIYTYIQEVQPRTEIKKKVQ